MVFLASTSRSWSLLSLRAAVFLSVACAAPSTYGQASATLGNGLSASAIGRGGEVVAESGGPLDAVLGNPAGLAGIGSPALEANAVGLVDGGSFQNAANSDAKIRGLAGALPYGAFATPIRTSPWVASFGVTPEILMRANWHYNDAPGTLGVSYGYQTQETQIIAVRSSLGLARRFGTKWAAGATLGIVYNQNDLHAPYIFQQQPQLAGLKVLLALTTRGYGWNGGAGVQWIPSPHLRTGLAWKSGTTLRTQGDASGSASALFTALGVSADAAFTYHAQVENHLPQGFDSGLSWLLSKHATLHFEGDFTAWGQAFQELPITVTNGSNAVINSVVGSNTFKDAVPLHWHNQGTFRAGLELPLRNSWLLRAGYAHASDPVPSSTLTPLTAAIMQNALAAGAGWTHGRWRCDAAYQAQLPATQSVGLSGLEAGEYSNSRVRVSTQSLTVGTRLNLSR
jgi:long-subunit fatty acid transport protein